MLHDYLKGPFSQVPLHSKKISKKKNVDAHMLNASLNYIFF